MEILPLEHDDLPGIAHFQPPDWPDVFPSFRYYIDASFCYPIKVIEGNEIVGVGTSIVHTDVAWLATIITHPEKRNRGVGTLVTSALIDGLKDSPCETIMLVATPLGEYVYKKLGFETDAEYAFFRNGELSDGKSIPENVLPFDPKYTDQLFALDNKAAGENRAMRLAEHLADAKIYVRRGNMIGFYLPSFGEGLVVAENAEAGNALLNAKLVSSGVIVMPKDNIAGSSYLESRGFTEFRTAARMRLGKKRPWHPEMIYSRVGGAIG